MTKHNLPIEERMLSKINKTDSCWLWTGKPANNGYGRLQIDGKSSRAHRLAYQLWIGPIPPDKPQVNHHCDIPLCVNPKHLYAGTAKQNMDDMNSRGRNHEFNKTHCPQGHEYNEINTHIDKNNARHCRECDRIRHNAARNKKKIIKCGDSH